MNIDKLEDLFEFIESTDAHLDGMLENNSKPPHSQLIGFVRDCATRVSEIRDEELIKHIKSYFPGGEL